MNGQHRLLEVCRVVHTAIRSHVHGIPTLCNQMEYFDRRRKKDSGMHRRGLIMYSRLEKHQRREKRLLRRRMMDRRRVALWQ